MLDSKQGMGIMKHKTLTYMFILLLSAVYAFSNAGTAAAYDFSVQTGFQIDWWKDDKDSRAVQAHIPVKIEARQGDYSLSLLAGYASTHVEPSPGENRTLSHLLDTKVNFSYAITERLPVDVLIGLDLNLPTGKTNFVQEELALIMDPDLVSINTFGEGFNVNPTVSVVMDRGVWTAGLGLGYLWRGEYDFSRNLQDYDPGDIVNATAEVRYYFSPGWSSRFFGGYAWYGKDRVEGEDFAQPGRHYLAGFGLNHDGTKWDAGLTVRTVMRDKSRFQETAGGLFTEDSNGHGREFAGDLVLAYLLNGKTALNASLRGLYITDNDYPESSSRFTGARGKAELGLGVSRRLWRNFRYEVNVKGFVMHDEETNFPEIRDARDFTGLSTVMRLTTDF